MKRLPVIIALVLIVLPVVIAPTFGISVEDNQFYISSPNIEFDMSTYFGGSAEDLAAKVHFDNEGNIIVVGSTLSDDLPVFNAQQDTYEGGRDGFVLKLNSSYDVVFCTYYGGSGEEYAEAVTTDDDNNIYITGHTESYNLSVPNGIQTEMRGAGDGFLAKLSPTGELLYGTYIGGNGENDWLTSIVVDENDDLIIAGPVDSDDMNTTTGAFQEVYGGGGADAILLSLSSDGQSYLFMTYFGGDSPENCGNIALDSEKNIVIGGYAGDANITTEGAYQETYGGGDGDVVVAKFNHNASTLLWSTFLGGSLWDFCGGVRIDSEDNVIVSGYSESSDFPLLNELYGDDGERDTFLSKLSGNGSELLFSTLLGGEDEDRCYGMEMLSNESVATLSFTRSRNLPAVDAWQENNSGSYDAYFTLYNNELSALIQASYIGGSMSDYGLSIDTFNDEYFALVGYTSSSDFPTQDPVQSERAGHRDAFIVVLKVAPDTTTTTTTEPEPTTTTDTASTTTTDTVSTTTTSTTSTTTTTPAQGPIDLLTLGIVVAGVIIIIIIVVYIKKSR
ncbi:MAG: SBBP repeat-containing protein [Candidatus Thorarchaeota archaeon]